MVNPQLIGIYKPEDVPDRNNVNNGYLMYVDTQSNSFTLKKVNLNTGIEFGEEFIMRSFEKSSFTRTAEKLGSVADVFNIWSSGSLTKCVETFKNEDITNEIVTIENAKEILKELLNESIVEKGSKLIIFVDELDRCNPIYAVKLLERIKHFFDDDRIIFVFSTNINQLTNTISNYYGSNFDSFKYLNKFFDISFDLNNVDSIKYIEHLGHKKSSYYFDNTVCEMTNYYNFSMRDCNRYMQSVNIVRDFVHIQRDGFKDNKGYQTLLMFYVPILLALKIVDIQKFIKVINGEGYNIFEKNILDNSKIYEGLEYRMRKNEQGKILEDDYKIQLQEMYNTIFNNDGNNEYQSSEIILDKDSKKELMEVVSLLKRGLNYK
jgi:hypothetical protein